MNKLLNFDDAVQYHYNQFPPKSLNYTLLMPSLLTATDALARYDQMLKNMHNSEILLAPITKPRSGYFFAYGRHNQHYGRNYAI